MLNTLARLWQRPWTYSAEKNNSMDEPMRLLPKMPEQPRYDLLGPISQWEQSVNLLDGEFGASISMRFYQGHRARDMVILLNYSTSCCEL